MDLPLTSKTAVELGMSPTPMPVEDEKRMESATVVVPVKTGRKPVVPPGVVTFELASGVTPAGTASVVADLDPASA